MNNIDSKIQNLPGAAPLIQKRDGLWMDAPELDVRQIALLMKQADAHFSTMTGAMLPNNETQVVYHFFADGQAYNFKVHTHENKLQSISTIFPAAEWIEREIQDLFKAEFIGHPHPDRLIRPIQLEPGFFREPGGAAGKEQR